MSGHSRWQQIKHKKALSDAKKGKLFSKIIRLIAIAAKEKGPDPASNPKVRMAIEKARSIGLPRENIERALERGGGKDEGAESLYEVSYEAYGAGGTALLIQGVTNNKNRTTNEIKHILTEYGGKFAERGSVEWMFEKVDGVDIPKEQKAVAHEELILAIIDAGAKDLKEYPEEIAAYLDPGRMESFKKELKRRGVTFGDSYIDYLPKTPLALPMEERGKLEKLLGALDEHDDVQDIYTNVSL